MKRKKITAITLLLASACVATSLGGATLALSADTATSVLLTDVFSSKDATISAVAESTAQDAKNVTAFTLSDKGSAWIKRSLALKWYEEKNALSTFTTTFAFEDFDFETVTLSMDTPSAWATKNEQSENSVRFRKTASGVKAYVINGELVEYEGVAEDKLTDQQKEFRTKEEALIASATEMTVSAKQEITLTLSEGANDGEFDVSLKIDATNYPLGTFTNIGANYAKYTYNESYPWTVSATMPASAADDATTTVLLHDINGQAFDDIVISGESNAKKYTVAKDTAAPVLVVNEDVDGFMLGTTFALDYTVIDVLQTKNLVTKLEYYQYNPTKELKDENYKTLSTSVPFNQTVYYDAHGEEHSVWRDEEAKGVAREFVSIRVSLSDDTFKDETKAVYNLAWYANASAVASPDSVNDYIILDRSEEGATYNYIILDDSDEKNAVNHVDSRLNTLVDEFMDVDGELTKAAEGVTAGSNSYIYFPSFQWLISDNNGYRNLKFTICYKTGDTTSSSSNLSYNALKLAVSKAGDYEFKIFATDKKGNGMKYANKKGEIVTVSAGNIWEIEAIPTFKFTIKDIGLSVEDPSSVNGRKDTEILDKKYTFDSMTVVGANSLQDKYALYQINLDEYNASNPNAKINISDLTSITYAEIASEVKTRGLGSVQDKDYFSFYLDIYAQKLAEIVGASDVSKVKACFEKIGEAGDTVNSEEKWEEYEWSADSKSFKTVKQGQYLLLADYWEESMANTRRAAGYKVLDVSSKATTITGDTEWLKNNVVSVILFAIAGVMLILIIILLLIKPSDETLEDVDKAAKNAKKAKKAKENDQE